MFILKCSPCNYASDSTLYASGKNLNQVRKNVEMDFLVLRKWFHESHMTLNREKVHYIVLGGKDPPHKIIPLINN